MGKSRGSLRRGYPRTPQGNDGGDDKERIVTQKAKEKQNQKKPPKPQKKEPEHRSLMVQPQKKVQWFRCMNPAYLKREYPFEWFVELDKVGDVECCHDCGAGGFKKIDTTEVGCYTADSNKEKEEE